MMWCLLWHIRCESWWCLAAILKGALLVEVVFYLLVSLLWSAPFCLISRLKPFATSSAIHMSVDIAYTHTQCTYTVQVHEKVFFFFFGQVCVSACMGVVWNVTVWKCLCVWVYVCTSAIGAVRYRSMQPYSMSVLLANLESFVPFRLSFPSNSSQSTPT